jgi:hypoxanthine phosphoribosyltransferase
MKLLWLSWEDVEHLCDLLAGKIRRSNFRPDVVVAVSRGGFPVARILCDELELQRLASLQIEYYAAPGQAKKEPKLLYPLNADVRGKRVLIVDDVADRGESLRLARKHVEEKGAGEVKIATLHYKPWSKTVPDFYVKKVRSWIVYPWERRETSKHLEKRTEL